MVEILEKIGFNPGQINLFREQKITPDIVSCLNLYEFQCLGVTDRNAIMKLRTECVVFGRTKNCGNTGRFDIPKQTIEGLLDSGFSIKDASHMLCISESTLYRKMRQYNLSNAVFTDIDNNMLDVVVEKMLTEFPHCGEVMLRGLLKGKGIKVTIFYHVCLYIFVMA